MSVIFTDGVYREEESLVIFAPEIAVKGVFDTILAVNGTPADARLHFERLIRDVDSVLSFPQAALPSFAELQQIWAALIEANGLENGAARVRTLVTKIDNVHPSLIINAEITQAPENLAPISCAIIRDFPRKARNKFENSKHTDYTRAFRAREKAATQGAEDAILTNTNGMIACGTVANIFIEEDGTLITPPLSDGVLAGITRGKIIAEKGAREESISEERLRNADAAFLTNSLIGMRKISQIS